MKPLISFLLVVESILVLMMMISVDYDAAVPIKKADVLIKHACRGGDFKKNSIIEKNRASALDQILKTGNASNNGFYHSQVGDKPEDQVSAVLFCPPNIPGEICKCCFRNLVPALLSNCSTQKEGVVWDTYYYYDCMARYSVGRKIVSVLDDWAWYRNPDSHDVKAVGLQKTIDSLLIRLTEEAAGGGAVKKFATGSAKYDGEEHVLYVVAMCSPDLSKPDCLKCLSKATTETRTCCTQKPLFSSRIMSTNCYINLHSGFTTASSSQSALLPGLRSPYTPPPTASSPVLRCSSLPTASSFHGTANRVRHPQINSDNLLRHNSKRTISSTVL
ncbi:hypothetical protein R6Q59_016608 [Mikania micrantha]